jgi:hypothetical protein
VCSKFWTWTWTIMFCDLGVFRWNRFIELFQWLGSYLDNLPICFKISKCRIFDVIFVASWSIIYWNNHRWCWFCYWCITHLVLWNGFYLSHNLGDGFYSIFNTALLRPRLFLLSLEHLDNNITYCIYGFTWSSLFFFVYTGVLLTLICCLKSAKLCWIC